MRGRLRGTVPAGEVLGLRAEGECVAVPGLRFGIMVRGEGVRDRQVLGVRVWVRGSGIGSELGFRNSARAGEGALCYAVLCCSI